MPRMRWVRCRTWPNLASAHDGTMAIVEIAPRARRRGEPSPWRGHLVPVHLFQDVDDEIDRDIHKHEVPSHNSVLEFDGQGGKLRH